MSGIVGSSRYDATNSDSASESSPKMRVQFAERRMRDGQGLIQFQRAVFMCSGSLRRSTSSGSIETAGSLPKSITDRA